MDAANFLGRVVPPGPFIAISWNMKPGEKRAHFAVRMAPNANDATGIARWADQKGFEVYHSQASFKLATPTQMKWGTQYTGSKDASNIHSTRAFYIDLDCSRPGDGKQVGVKCYADKKAALMWLYGTLIPQGGLPPPSLLVDSGWGIHVYWIVEDPMLPAPWQPLADALKNLMTAKGFTGDFAITVDVARILRLPGSRNLKDPANPKLVSVMAAGPDIPNQVWADALRPWIGAAPTTPGPGAGHSRSATVTPLGPRPQLAAFAGGAQGPNLAAAAQSFPVGYAPPREPFFMKHIAGACAQVSTTLANGGNGDSYNVWYPMMTLASFCQDAADFYHPLSSGDPRYSQGDVDNIWVPQIAAEKAAKPHLGPPTCAAFNNERPSLCVGCPHLGHIKSPIVLGREPDDLPYGYRRGAGCIEVSENDENGNQVWRKLIFGDLSEFRSDIVEKHLVAGFHYAHGNISHAVTFEIPTLAGAGKPWGELTKQGLVCRPEKAKKAVEFIVAWAEHVNAKNQSRNTIAPSFGWATNHGKTTGFAIAGTCIREDGREEPTRPGDPFIMSQYGAVGDMPEWRAACDFVTQGRPDLATLVAGAFGAPLVYFSGVSGCIVSSVSRESGIGKTSAIQVGQAVWGNPRTAINALDDTGNSVTRRLAEVRSLPAYWDEVRVGDGKHLIQLLFALSQGKEKARLNADSTSRAVAEWQTLMMVATNDPLQDHIAEHTPGTDAGALRCFEWQYNGGPIPQTPGAAAIIGKANTNYGVVGRTYARWLAMNHKIVGHGVQSLIDGVNTKLGARNEERFFVAAIACLVSGMGYSNMLGLTNFDTKGVRDFLFQTFYDLRSQRSIASVVTSTGYDLDQILADFLSDHQGGRIYTDWLAPLPARPVSTLQPPNDSRSCVVQIAVNDKIARIYRPAFTKFLRSRKLSAQAVEKDLIAKAGAVLYRKPFAVGTPYSLGHSWVLDIPLTSPALSPLLLYKK